MRRRHFIVGLGSAAASWPAIAHAQQGERVRRIGVLMAAAANDPEHQARLAAFTQALKQLGWSDASNLQIDTRWTTAEDMLIFIKASLGELKLPDFLGRAIALTHQELFRENSTHAVGMAWEERQSGGALLLYKNGAHYFICKPPDFSQLKKVIELSLQLISKEENPQPPKEKFLLSNLKSIFI